MDDIQPCIKCQVHTKYVAEQSDPDKQRYVFAYIITIKNLSRQPVQLLTRHWLITDANNKQLTVEGEGVVGEQPHIPAGEEYTYASGTAIETPLGVMQGYYTMQCENGETFKTEVEPFRLAMPNIIN
ncbi:Co2+/Mg2+ efflux protein ApaG [Vibrio sp. SCSIO 43136]|uniref:Co2+/Mg2+ efflux protein ApaG n=1 Tax=Vibrio sp. SCSIO 43136 TaxID=2819101 RepID=UPI002075C650|nr:Co2+/Mg2+ efflux protein ApaG [Vibrio sp. SCSIO 43136]USD64954.1 Co2+/Mg2+ efflux protein ApaG [Vibrio sp. SCSIO 43136]